MSLTEKTYEAFYDTYGTSQAVTSPDGNLVILLPPLAQGNHVVTIRIANQSYDLNFSVRASEVIVNPKSYINSLLSDASEELESFKSTTKDYNVQLEITSLQQQLTQQFALISSLNETDAANLAQILKVNSSDLPSNRPDVDSCNALDSVMFNNQLAINRLIRLAIGASAGATLINPLFGVAVALYTTSKLIVH